MAEWLDKIQGAQETLSADRFALIGLANALSVVGMKDLAHDLQSIAESIHEAEQGVNEGVGQMLSEMVNADRRQISKTLTTLLEPVPKSNEGGLQ